MFWKTLLNFLPVAPEESRFFVAQLRDTYFLYRRVAQGRRAGPLLWARFISLVMRLSQGGLGSAGRLSCYADDPIACLKALSQGGRLRRFEI
eukprot:1035469-Amphidinium_carterae.1